MRMSVHSNRPTKKQESTVHGGDKTKSLLAKKKGNTLHYINPKISISRGTTSAALERRKSVKILLICVMQPAPVV